jgi:hypothetical protein
MADNNGCVSIITGDGNTSQKPTTGLFTPERKAVQIKDMGASTPPGHNAPIAPFVNPDPKSKHSF